MKRNTFIAGLVAITATIGSAAWADSHTAKSGAEITKDAAELSQFVTNNPQFASVIQDLETKTGGKVTEAEFDDDMGDGTTHVEFEVTLANGSDEDHIYSIADGSMTLEVDNDHDDQNEAMETEEAPTSN